MRLRSRFWLLASVLILVGAPAARAASAEAVEAVPVPQGAAAPAPRFCTPPPPDVEGGPDLFARALKQYVRGKVYQFERRHTEAARAFEAAAALAPDAAIIWWHLGAGRFDIGDLQGAADAVDKALAIDPGNDAALYIRGRAARGLNRPAEAKTFFKRLAETGPKDSNYRILALYYMGRTCQEGGDIAGAADYMAALVDAVSEPQPYFRKNAEVYMLAQSVPQLRLMAGRLQLLAGRTDEAIATFERCLEDKPDSSDVVGLIVKANLQARRFDAARDAARRFIELQPDETAGYQYLAEAYRAEGRLDDLVAELQRLRLARAGNRTVAFQLASALEDAGRKGEAEAIYRELSDAPAGGDDTGASLKLAELFIRDGRPLDALETLATALSEGEDEAAVLIRAARLIDSLPNPAEAYEKARPLVADTVKGHGPFVLVGMLAERAGRRGDALALYDKAIARQPKAGIAYSRKAELLIQDERYEDALAVYQQALDAGLGLAVFHRKMGMILDQMGRYDEALVHYRQAKAGAPGDRLTRYLLSGVLIQLGRYDEAAAALRETIADMPKESRAYLQLARLQLSQGRMDEAKAVLQQARSAGIAASELQATEAEVALREGRLEDAERIAREALAARVGDRDARLILAHALAGRGAYKEAAAEMRALLAADPENIDLRYMLAGVYQQMGAAKAAEGELLLILKAQPDHAPSNNDLGYLWADRGERLAEAERMIRAAVKARPENPAFLDSLGWVLYKRGRFEEAAEALVKATAMSPDLDGVLWDHLGDAYWRLSRREEAVAAWEKAGTMYEKAGASAPEGGLDRVREKVRQARAGGEPPLAPAVEGTAAAPATGS